VSAPAERPPTPPELDAETQALANALFARMTGPGRWSIALEGEDGVVRRWSRKEGPKGAPALESFDQQEGE
jgi:hypothetical protein